MADDFSDYPQSISEIRGRRDGNAGTWNPRDALVSALRDLDNGLDVRDCIVIFNVHHDDGTIGIKYYAATNGGIFKALGLIELAKLEIVSDAG